MLELHIKGKEFWNSKTNEFEITRDQTICLEHSLVSLSKWESKYKKPFLSSDKTNDEIIDYIKFMTITQNVDPKIYNSLNKDELNKINSYIADPMTATWFSDNKKQATGTPVKRSTEKITSELIYYWMISFQIPFECQKWHLNRLLTLIRICNVKEAQQNGKSNKMSKRDILSQNRALNAARRQQLQTKG